MELIKWLREGDQNTAFFFNRLNESQLEDKSAVSQPSEVPPHFIQFFRDLLNGGQLGTPLETSLLRTIDEDEGHRFEAPVLANEIFNLVHHLNWDISPGPEGFGWLLLGLLEYY